MRTLRHEPSDAELEVLKTLWEMRRGTVREIGTALRRRKKRWAYTTVLTLLRRLLEKRLVRSDKRQAAHVFHPAVTQTELVRQRLQQIARSLCPNQPEVLVEAMLADQSPRQIAKLRATLKSAHKTRSKKKRRA